MLCIIFMITDLRWTAAVVDPKAAYLIDFRSWFRVSNWQFVSQFELDAIMYHKLCSFRWSACFLKYRNIQFLNNTSGLLRGTFGGLLAVVLNSSSFLCFCLLPTFCTDLINFDSFLSESSDARLSISISLISSSSPLDLVFSKRFSE